MSKCDNCEFQAYMMRVFDMTFAEEDCPIECIYPNGYNNDEPRERLDAYAKE